MDQVKMGKLIAKIRKEKGLTQFELGEKLGVNAQAVSKWESGRTAPDISIINELADILEVTTSDLLKGLQTPKPPDPQNKFKVVLFWVKRHFIFVVLEIFLIIQLIFLVNFYLNNHDKYKIINFRSVKSPLLIEGKIITFPKKDYIVLNQLFFNDVSENSIIEDKKVIELNLILKNKDEVLYVYKNEILDDYGKNESFSLADALNSIPTLFFEVNTSQNEYDNLTIFVDYIDTNSEETTEEIKIEKT